MVFWDVIHASGTYISMTWRNLLLPIHFCPKDGDSRFFQSVTTYLPDYTVSHPRSLKS